MRQSTASNLAVVLALLSWPLCYYGFMSQLGDFAHGTPREVIQRHQAISLSVLSVGLLSLIASLWLSGFSFSGARRRSFIATLVASSLLGLGIVSLWP